MFQGCIKGVSKVYQGCFKEVSGLFQGCFKEVSGVFQGSFKDVSRKLKSSEGIITKLSPAPPSAELGTAQRQLVFQWPPIFGGLIVAVR